MPRVNIVKMKRTNNRKKKNNAGHIYLLKKMIIKQAHVEQTMSFRMKTPVTTKTVGNNNMSSVHRCLIFVGNNYDIFSDNYTR